MILVLAAAALAQSPPVDWAQTPNLFAGKFATVKLSGGGHIGGNWISVTPDSFTIKVESTSNSKAVPKGIQTLPKSSILELKARHIRVRGRVLGTIGGLTAGNALAVAITRNRDGGQGPFVFAILGTAVAGYFIGKILDESTQVILFN